MNRRSFLSWLGAACAGAMAAPLVKIQAASSAPDAALPVPSVGRTSAAAAGHTHSISGHHSLHSHPCCHELSRTGPFVDEAFYGA